MKRLIMLFLFIKTLKTDKEKRRKYRDWNKLSHALLCSLMFLWISKY
ncbi:unnamed protein product [Larinioides sclopetarius]|uniref:Uncharacterized protein n=1 Tax=Larinioides sclopetarius TaxID=280406 RepID=A0AAV2A872_9ARAC